METIREALKKSLDIIPIKEIETPEGTFQDGGVLPIAVQGVLKAFALILYVDAAQRTGSKIDKKVVTCLSSALNFNSLAQGLQIGGFMQWWLDQEAVVDWWDEDFNEKEDYNVWSEEKCIIEKWNEFATLSAKGEKP